MKIPLNATIGEYRIVDFVGAGGMGEVYRAIHHKINRVVAIKVLTCPDSSENATARFINEARIQASLHHANIATLYDFIEFKNCLCIIMEYIEGQTLYERIKTKKFLPHKEAISIFRAVVDAIAYLHVHNTLHRDIKSHNIKISSSGEVKLLDFGIARDATTPQLTRLGCYVGTLNYLAPEQIRGKPGDVRSDIWSLGVLLYEMSVGKLPFTAASINEIYAKIDKGEYVKPSAINTAIPQELENIIVRCLKKNPSERYSSAKELLDDIRWLPVDFSGPSCSVLPVKQRIRWRSLAEIVRQNWPLVISISLLFLFSIIGLLLFHGEPPILSSPSQQDDSFGIAEA